MAVIMTPSIREAAEDLVRANIEAEPAIIKAYLFPSEREIRLVYVDPTTSPLHAGERVAPFYFGASKSAAQPAASYTAAIALVLPKEEGQVPLPEEWGDWTDGDVVWENRLSLNAPPVSWQKFRPLNGGTTVVYKPRNKRLSPEKVRANLSARQERLAGASTLNERFARATTPNEVIEEAQQEVIIRVTKVATAIHTGLQSFAEINPAYRPLIGDDWKETLRRAKAYADALPEAERKEFHGQFMGVAGRSGFDPLEFAGLLLLANLELMPEPISP